MTTETVHLNLESVAATWLDFKYKISDPPTRAPNFPIASPAPQEVTIGFLGSLQCFSSFKCHPHEGDMCTHGFAS